MALGTYIKAEERALDESRSKNRREEGEEGPEMRKKTTGTLMRLHSKVFDLPDATCDSMEFQAKSL